ncbi:unnamed protein product [Clavelina lepadiformis]|uniref:Disease resistance R13L4/SHOC-2-like LRR domain-containing protein n=1 Tax=Clavelina lepadiformis TaxID=159417 RepID=A0ABP0F2C6_CLALP
MACLKCFRKNQSEEAKRRCKSLMLEAKCEASDIFDLSNCELRSLPPIFSICRAKNIQTLILHTNLLKSLKAGGMLGDLKTLQVLDLHDNRLTTLPEDIGLLQNLMILNVENNMLSELPFSFGQLEKLEKFSARDNILTCLPKSFDALKSLKVCDVSGTNQIRYLPRELCFIRTLESLVLPDPNLMEFPPAIIALEGLDSIMKFLCRDCGINRNASKSQDDEICPQPGISSRKLRNSVVEEREVQNIEYNQQLAKRRKEKAELLKTIKKGES